MTIPNPGIQPKYQKFFSIRLKSIVVVSYYMLYVVWSLFGNLTSHRKRAGMVSDQTLCLLSPKEVPKLKSNILSLIIKTTTTAIYGRYYCGSALPQVFDIDRRVIRDLKSFRGQSIGGTITLYLGEYLSYVSDF